MQWENLFYALTQWVHNFGAVAVVAGALVLLLYKSAPRNTKRNLAALVIAGWSAQIATGLMFGGISLYFYGETPDLHAVALWALMIKLFCAVLGLTIATFYFVGGQRWSDKAQNHASFALTGFGIVALTAAAFLRWFS